MPLPSTPPTDLESFAAAIDGVLAGDVAEPMRSAALEQLADELDTIAWKHRAAALAESFRARSGIAPGVDLLSGLTALVDGGHLSIR